MKLARDLLLCGTLFLVACSTLKQDDENDSEARFPASVINNPVTDGQYINNVPGYIDPNPVTNQYIDGIPSIKYKLAVDHDIDNRTPSRILHDDYLAADGSFKVEQVDKVIAIIQSRERTLFIFQAAAEEKSDAVKSNEGLNKLYENRNNPNVVANSKFLQKWADDRDRVTYTFAINQLTTAKQRAILLNSQKRNFKDVNFLNSKEARPLLEALFQGLSTQESLISDTRQDNVDFDKEKFPASFKHMSIGQNKVEALDLVKNQDGNFLSPGELRSAAKSGQDLSKLDPVYDGLWRRPGQNIASFDTTNYSHQTDSYIDPEVRDPNQIVEVWFEKESEGMGWSPKLTVRYKNRDKITQKFKLKIETPTRKPSLGEDGPTALTFAGLNQMETKSQAAANEIAAAVGFRVDPSFFKRTVKLYVNPDGKSIRKNKSTCEAYNKTFDAAVQNMVTKLNSRYLPDSWHLIRGEGFWDYKAALSNVQVDPEAEGGCKYLSLQNSAMTPKVFGDRERIGYFSNHAMGRPFKRAYRGLLLFRALVNDIDVHDKNSETEFSGDKLIMTPTDMGESWGNFMIGDRPMAYNPNFIKKIQKDGSIETSYWSMAGHFKYFDTITLNDAKWLARLVGQLTPDQVKNAFLNAGQPDIVAETYMQTFMSRRDQLLTTLHLINDNSPKLSEFTKYSRLTDVAKNYIVPGHAECYKGNQLLDSCIDPGVDPNHADTQQFKATKFMDESTVGQAEQAEVKSVAGTGLSALAAESQSVSTTPTIHKIHAGFLDVIPFRVSMPSPIGQDNSWVVDVYPCKLGANLNIVNHAVTPSILMTPTGGAFRLNYLAVIRPVESPIKDDLKFYDLYFKQAKDSVRKVVGECESFTHDISEQLIDQLGPRDILFVGHSYAAGGGPQVTGGVITDSFLFQKEWFKNLIIQKKDNNVDATWIHGQEIDFNPIDLAAQDSIIRIPLVVASLHKSNEEAATYEFNWTDGSNSAPGPSVLESRNELLSSITSESWDVKKLNYGREKKVDVKNFFISLGGLVDYGKTSRAVETDTRDQKGSVDKVYMHVREKNSDTSQFWLKTFRKPINENILRVRAGITTSGELVGSVEFSYEQDFTTGKDLERVRNSVMKILPNTFLPVKGSDTNWYQGNTVLLGSIFLSGDGIKRILATTPESAAIAMSAALTENGVQNPKAIGLFTKRLTQVQSAVSKMLSASTSALSDKQRLHLNHAIADSLSSLLYIKEGDRAAVKALEALAGEENVHREAKLMSNAASLPGHLFKLELNDVFKGGMSDEKVAYLKQELGLTQTPQEITSDTISMLILDYVNHGDTIDLSKSNRFNTPTKDNMQPFLHPTGGN